MHLHRFVRTTCLLGFAICCSLPGVALADDLVNERTWSTLSAGERQQVLRAFDVVQSTVAGVQNAGRETGALTVRQAALNDRFYQDQRQGIDRGLRLVWQRSANLLSVSEEGLSLTRKF